ncbi:MAG TPA: DUF559 domain-containing protein [Spirochaetota bacterium]|nr:DUF559 domain-containing protein [Spirochaetota bacterium]
MGNSGIIKGQSGAGRKTERARELRKEQTAAEEVFWGRVRNRKFKSLKFRRQQVIDGCIVDFYCEELKLSVEIDGSVHDNEQQVTYDTHRDKILSHRGIRIVRLRNEAVLADVDRALDELYESISFERLS